jgi:hypothetical protein
MLSSALRLQALIVGAVDAHLHAVGRPGLSTRIPNMRISP